MFIDKLLKSSNKLLHPDTHCYARFVSVAALHFHTKRSPQYVPVSKALHLRKNEVEHSKYGFIGILIGGIALLLALVHFWAGPFSPQPTLETVVAQKAASIRTAALDALKGNAPKNEKVTSKWDNDKVSQVTTAVLGGLAFFLAVISFAQKEPFRVSGGAAALGVSAIAFQFIAMYAMALLVVILIAAALTSLGVG